MATTMASDTYIELLLRDALREAGVEFKEQYRIYEKGDLYCPKYTVDFLVSYQGRRVAVECDGRGYHSSDKDVDRDIERDDWLRLHGYGDVLHFTTAQLKNEMDTVIRTIKDRLGIEKFSPGQLKFRGRAVHKAYITNVQKADLHCVTLYYAYTQVKDKMWMAYKLRDDTLERWSEERVKAFFNVPEKAGAELALYTALKDLKRSVRLLVYCPSQWLTTHFNARLAGNYEWPELLKGIEEILSEQNYLLKYINIQRGSSFYHEPEAWRFIIQALRSRCMQMRHQTLHEGKTDGMVDYEGLVLKKKQDGIRRK